MTTLASNAPRSYEGGNRNDLPVVATDIIYEGAAVGAVAGTGHTRPLQGGDRFVGFAVEQADNSAGVAAALDTRLITQGKIELSVSGAVITDIGQPVYATDDDTFVFSPVGASFIGFVKRFVSSGVVIVEFNVDCFTDPYGAWPVREEITATKTLDAQDCGKAFFATAAADGDAITLPAIADGLTDVLIVTIGAFGSTGLVISPNASDNIRGPDLTAVDDKDLLGTKATQRRGDWVYLTGGDADGYAARVKGTFTKE